MLKNYLKTVWRNIMRHKTFSLINVLGLALGMTCCLFIFLWVKDERSVDNLPSLGSKVYAVYQTTSSNGQIGGSYSTPLRVITGQNYPTFLMEISTSLFLKSSIRLIMPRVTNCRGGILKPFNTEKKRSSSTDQGLAGIFLKYSNTRCWRATQKLH